MTRAAKPSPFEALQLLKAGNERFVKGQMKHPHQDLARVQLSGSANQADHAYASILSCSDSRVPVELIFDAGVMDLFIIRVAGNVCNGDEIGSIEYGLAHVHTPVLVVLGHTQCGAVTAVTHALQGKGHALERNIPPLVKSIEPAVRQAMADHPNAHGNDILPHAIEANVWRGIETLFMESPVTRDLIKRGAAKVVGALYDVSTGTIHWLPETRCTELLMKAESNPDRAL